MGHVDGGLHAPLGIDVTGETGGSPVRLAGFAEAGLCTSYTKWKPGDLLHRGRGLLEDRVGVDVLAATVTGSRPGQDGEHEDKRQWQSD